jgi:hypothetical protein
LTSDSEREYDDISVKCEVDWVEADVAPECNRGDGPLVDSDLDICWILEASEEVAVADVCGIGGENRLLVNTSSTKSDCKFGFNGAPKTSRALRKFLAFSETNAASPARRRASSE